jgi:hypothetical protein
MVILALLLACANTQTSEGQSIPPSVARDSIRVLPRVTVESGITVHWPDHARLQQSRQASRDSLLGELAAARARWRPHSADRVSYRLVEKCFCMASWDRSTQR